MESVRSGNQRIPREEELKYWGRTRRWKNGVRLLLRKEDGCLNESRVKIPEKREG